MRTRSSSGDLNYSFQLFQHGVRENQSMLICGGCQQTPSSRSVASPPRVITQSVKSACHCVTVKSVELVAVPSRVVT